jgi:phospholipid/cholesterol/gamma-HCH transport system substrate-binding protein
MEAVGRKEGAIGALLEEGGPGEQAVNELRDTAASLRRTVEKLESRDNLLGRMLNDREYSERVASDLEELLRNLREITGKINRGEGTVGALVNDRAVYDGIEDIVVGVNDSDFARWLTRRYRKKGIVVQEEDPAPDEAP